MRTKRYQLPVRKVSFEMTPSGPESEAPVVPTAEQADDPEDDSSSELLELLRVSDVAHLLRLSERSIHSYLAQGLLERVRIGTRTIRITRASVLKLMGQAAE